MKPNVQVAIKLDREERVYHSGEIIKGKVIIFSDGENVAEFIIIYFVGQAHVDFKRYKKHCSSEEVILRLKVAIRRNDGQLLTLPNGQSELPFSFKLPESLLSTTNYENGSITYFCEGTIKIINTGHIGIVGPFNFSSPREPFTVIAIVDLNNDLPLKYEVVRDGQHELSACGLSKGVLSYTIKMTKSGFAPGEVIRLLVEIDNQSEENIDTCAQLQQNITFVGKCEFSLFGTVKSSSPMDVSSVNGIQVSRQKKVVWKADLLINPVPPSGQEQCKIIQIQYQIVVKFQPQYSKQIQCKIPIVIGTVPILMSTAELGGQHMVNTAARTHPGEPFALCWQDCDEGDLDLPPTYEQAVNPGNCNY